MIGDFVDRADIRVIKGGRRAGFSLEALQRDWVMRQVVGKKLEGDALRALGIFGLLENAHSSAAKLAEDAIVGKGLLNQ